jgi:hypothetical protein
MDRRERLTQALSLERPDRPPILGGWLAAPSHVQALTGCSDGEYWTDPFHWGLEAERVLGSDALMDVFVPISDGEFRCVDQDVFDRRTKKTEESVLAEIEALPDPADVKADFDEEAEYAAFAAELKLRQAQCGEIVWSPADWDLRPRILWYTRFGYEGTLMTIGRHPERFRKVIQVNAERGRQRAILQAKAIAEGLRPPAILTGEDLCSQQGPMVSPDYLRREYFPLVEYAFEPLLDVDAKIIWHCDGDYRLLVDDVLACGAAGLQGFQEECGMDLEWIVEHRTCHGDPLIIFGPMSVTTTLPFGSVADVADRVQQAMDICRDRASLVFFVSNTITPDIPLENVRAFWDAVLQSAW